MATQQADFFTGLLKQVSGSDAGNSSPDNDDIVMPSAAILGKRGLRTRCQSGSVFIVDAKSISLEFKRPSAINAAGSGPANLGLCRAKP